MEFKETDTTELKVAVNKDFKKEIVAFANSGGGEIFVGVADDGTVVGVEHIAQEMERIGNMIRDGIRPDLTAYTSMRTVEADGHEIIALSILSGEKKPYHLSDKGLKPGGVYVRHGISSVPASENMIREMIKSSDGIVFDKMRSILQELTFVYTTKYFADHGVSFGQENYRALGMADIDGYFTNTALLLSDQCPYSIKCAVFEGTGKTKFKSRKEFQGSILKQLEDAYAYLDLNNNVSSDFEGLRRIDHYEYPPYAVREALLNTIVHRDYNYSGSTLVNIFDDRMEFVSLGGLVRGITMEDILNGISQSRNMVLAAVFYRLELIESYGTGVRRILEAYEDCLENPSFKSGPASFLTILPNKNFIQGNGYELTDEEKVLGYLLKKGEISRRDVERILGCSSFPATRMLEILQKEGKIVRTGKARATKYLPSGK